MGGATPHGGVEPSVGPKTVVVGFPRVVVVCLLALAELARRKAAAVEGMNLDKVGKAEASKPPRALHADRPADASLESLHSLSKVVGTHKAPFALGRTGRTAGYQVVHVIIHLAETADSQTEDRAILKQALLDRALCANRCAAPFLIGLTSFPDVLALDSPPAKVGRVARISDAYFGLVSRAGPRARGAHREGLQFEQRPAIAFSGRRGKVRAYPLSLTIGLRLLPVARVVDEVVEQT